MECLLLGTLIIGIIIGDRIAVLRMRWFAPRLPTGGYVVSEEQLERLQQSGAAPLVSVALALLVLLLVLLGIGGLVLLLAA